MKNAHLFVLICDDCIDEEHVGHDVKSIKKFIKEADLHELKKNCESVNCVQMKSQIKEEVESRFVTAIDGIEERAAKLKAEIDSMKAKKLEECKEMQAKNMSVVNEVVSLVDPSDIVEKINNLPSSGGRTQYAEVALAILNYQKVVESDDFEIKTEGSLFIPSFSKGKIQKSRLEKMFGNLEFEEEDLDEFCKFDDDNDDDSSDEIDSSDDENEPEEDHEEGLHDFVED